MPSLHLAAASLVLLRVAAVGGVQANTLSVSVSKDGSYALLVNNITWLTSADTFVHVQHRRYSTSDGTLRLQSLVQHKGVDAAGAYERHEATWTAGGAQWITAVKVYGESVVFIQVRGSGE